MTAYYKTRVSLLESELEKEKEIEHVITTVEYVPMPVDYPVMIDENVISEITLLAQTAFGEDRGVDVRPESVVAVMETVMNRVFSDKYPNTVVEVVTQENAYQGYSPNNPIDYRYYDLACDVYLRSKLRKLGISDPGYVIPYDCYCFSSNNDHVNHFRLDDGTEVFPSKDVYTPTIVE